MAHPMAPDRASFKAVMARLLLPAVIGALATTAGATYQDDIGYTALWNELGALTPNGAGIKVTQTEGQYAGGYLPDPNVFPGKTFVPKSGGTGTISSHATNVGVYFYGVDATGRGITAIDCYEANNWIYAGFLRTNSWNEPLVEASRIQNHSWITDLDSASLNQEALRRLDYAIQRDGFLAVVGVNNGAGTTLPPLLGSGYNSLSVGLTSGNHSYGFTTMDGAGRIKPDIVAPGVFTSYSTPMVAGAASMLLQTADADPVLSNARTNSEVLKAILMAGATKEEFPDWNRTTSRPLDDIYGAGELNIYNSYHILAAGQQPASSSSNVPTTGWDFDQVTSASSQRTYFLNVPAGYVLRNFSSLLSWNRVVTDGNPNPTRWDDPTSALANLDMELLNASSFVPGTLVTSSRSTVDNVEHVYRFTDLLAGQYALRVTADFAGTTLTSSDFALAWRGALVVEMPGDFNLDHAVDGLDFLRWQANFNMWPSGGAQYTNGDANGDGIVDGLDFLVWQANFAPNPGGLVASPAGQYADMGAPGLAVIPEPSTALMLVGAVCLLRRRRR